MMRLFTLSILLFSLQLNSQSKFVQFTANTLSGTKTGIRNSVTTNEVLPAKFDKILPESDGKFACVIDNRLGYFDTTGKEIIAIKFKDGSSFNEGRAVVFDGQKWFMIDSKGMQVGQERFDDVVGLSEGVAKVVKGGLVGSVNRYGKLIIPCKYKDVSDCTYGFIVAEADYHEIWGDVTQKGKKIGEYGTTVKAQIVYNADGAIIYKGEIGETIDLTPTGKIVVNKTTTDGNFRSTSRSKMLDSKGKEVVSYEQNLYIEVLDFAIRTLRTDGILGYGIMDHDGKELLKPNFQQIDWFQQTVVGFLAKVYFKNSNDYFFVNVDGNCVPFENAKCPSN